MMHGESPVYSPYPFEDDKLLGWVKLCIDSPDWLCLIAWEEGDRPPRRAQPIGFIAVGSVDMIFSNTRTVDDLGLFVVPKRRGSRCALRLVLEMESWAKDKGSVIRLGVTTGTNDESAERFLKRLGYVQSGVMLAKPII
jgi:GNAT superfamily N-acetyltransferase